MKIIFAFVLFIFYSPIYALEVKQDIPTLEEKITKLQHTLHSIGIDEFYIGGSGAIAILDYAFGYNQEIKFRDLDLMIVANTQLGEIEMQNLVNQLDPFGKVISLRKKIRAKVDMPNYHAGYSFYIIDDDQLVFDFGIFHQDQDLDLNGILTIEQVLLKFDYKTTLTQYINKAKDYAHLVEFGEIRDINKGYLDWRNKNPVFTNWDLIKGESILTAFRIVNNFQKLGSLKIPEDKACEIRKMVNMDNTIDGKKFYKLLFKILDHKHLGQSLKNLGELGVFEKYDRDFLKSESALSILCHKDFAFAEIEKESEQNDIAIQRFLEFISKLRKDFNDNHTADKIIADFEENYHYITDFKFEKWLKAKESLN